MGEWPLGKEKCEFPALLAREMKRQCGIAMFVAG